MSDKCDITKNTNKVLDETHKEVSDNLDNSVENLFPSDELEEEIISKIELELESKGINTGDIIETDVVRQAYSDIYGEVNERELHSIEIKALLRTNPVGKIILKDYLLNKGLIGKYKRLRDYPLSTLKNMIAVLTQFNDSDENHGIFGSKGNIIVRIVRSFKKSLYTPQELGKRENTGALYKFANAMRSYYEAVQNRINLFAKGRKESWVTKDTSGKPVVKSKFYEGMATIVEELQKIVNEYAGLKEDGSVLIRDTHIPYQAGYRHNDIAIQELFHQIMTGWVEIRDVEIKNEDGKVIGTEKKFFIATNYNTKKDKDDKVEFYDAPGQDGSAKFEFQNFEPIETAFDGEYNLPLPSEAIDKLEALIERARKIDNEVFKYFQKEFDKSVDKLLEAYSKQFPKLSQDQIKAMFFNPKSKVGKTAIGTLNSNQKKLYDRYMKSFDGFTSLDFFQYQTDDTSFKKNHFPIIYNKDKFNMMYDNALAELRNNLKNLKETKENWDKSIKKSDTDKISKFDHFYKGKAYKGMSAHSALRKDINSTESAIRRMEIIRDNRDDYGMNVEGGDLVPVTADQKHLKRITNAFNPMNMRMDAGVYNDYLKTGMTAIERNLLTAQLIESVGMIQDKDGNINEEIFEYMMNYYSVPFNKTSTYGTLGPIKYSADNVTRFGPVKAEKVQHVSQTIGSFITGRYLGGAITSLKNMTAITQHANLFGIRLTHRHTMRYLSMKNNDPMMDLISRSGVIDFNDFFSETMVNDIADTQLEAATSHKILGAMLVYWKKVNKNRKGEPKYKKEMEELISRALNDSRAWNLIHEGITVISEGRAKKRMSKLKEQRNRDLMSKFANFAINKEYQFSRHLSGVSMKMLGIDMKMSKANLYNVVASTYTAWPNLKKAYGITMGKTETFIRSVAFMIGVEHAQDLGIIPRKPLNEFNAQEESLAIEYGRWFSKLSNYGLSTSDVGEFNMGAIGNQMGKFVYWSQQKFGGDKRILNEGKNAYKSLENLKGELGPLDTRVDNVKALMKLWKDILNPKNALKLRKLNPEAATIRNFVISQTILVGMVDILLLGGLSVPYRLSKQLGVAKTVARGMSSDLLALYLAPINLTIMAMMGGYDDDEEVERTLQHYMSRVPMIGFAPRFALDTLLGIYSGIAGDGRTAAWRAVELINMANPAFPITDFLGFKVALVEALNRD
tara:strand:+ start:7939 stop:11499 length:3561 start_codon:yes stop_codon:yes gene_type:complete